MGIGLLFGRWNVLKLDRGGGYTTVNALQMSELYTL